MWPRRERVCGLMLRFPHERGRGGRLLLSNRMLRRVSQSARISTSFVSPRRR